MQHFFLFLLVALASLTPGFAQEVSLTGNSQPANLPLAGRATSVALTLSMEPGEPIAQWKEACRAARSKGDRLPERPTVAMLELNYDDGRSERIGLRYGESISAARRDWWNPEEGFVAPMAFASPVSAGERSDANALSASVNYLASLPNPRPATALKSVRLAPGPDLGQGTVKVMAASLENASPSGKTYFVAADGNDEADGGFDQPWATLAKAAATIQAGDTVYVRGGIYKPTARIAFRNLKAPEGSRTQLIGYPGETATFDFMDAHWDTSPEREPLGFESTSHDQSMILVHACERFTLSNLHVIQSRARGFGMEGGADNEISHNFVFRTFGPGIRFAAETGSRCIGNTIIRPTSIDMGPTDPDNLGAGPVAFESGARRFARYSQNQRGNNPPMEGIDAGKLTSSEIAYNEIAWGDKECLLADGDMNDLRIHHNYVHNANNRPWAWGIAPNGYGVQENIEIDHNIAHNVGSAFGIGTEGGGYGKNVRIHHNLSWDCAWNPHSVTGAWGDGDADLTFISITNNTAWHNGYLEGNTGPAGGIKVSFSRNQGKGGRAIKGVVEDVTVANNLILKPRDYATAFINEGDPVASRIVFTHNLTDLAAESDLFALEKNNQWRAHRDENLIVFDKPVLRDPDSRDFRLLPGTPAVNGGIAIGPDGKIDPNGPATYMGAFGPGAKWIEWPKP